MATPVSAMWPARWAFLPELGVSLCFLGPCSRADSALLPMPCRSSVLRESKCRTAWSQSKPAHIVPVRQLLDAACYERTFACSACLRAWGWAGEQLRWTTAPSEAKAALRHPLP